MSANQISLSLPTKPPVDSIGRAIARLHLHRRAIISAGQALCAVALTGSVVAATAVIDHFLPLSRSIRVAVMAAISTVLAAILFRVLYGLIKAPAPVAAAREIERASGVTSNAIVTYFECSTAGEGESRQSYLYAMLHKQALGELNGINRSLVLPQRRLKLGVALTAICAAVYLLILFAAPSATHREARRLLLLEPDTISAQQPTSGPASEDAKALTPSIDTVSIRVVPPPYSGLTAVEYTADEPVKALLNSEIEIKVRATADSVNVRFTDNSISIRTVANNVFSGSFRALKSGALEVALADSNASSIVRAIEVVPDAPPQVKLLEPAADQILKDVPSQPIALKWQAADDLALAAIGVKYIRSRGDGDAAKFVNGSLSDVSPVKDSAKSWRGTAELDLRKLGGQQGDTFVFWVEARDGNPFVENIGRSGSVVIAIAAPRLEKLELTDLGAPEIARFVISQRKIINDTEELHRSRKQLPSQEFLNRSKNIAADQRDFKNSFNEFIDSDEHGGGGPQASLEEQAVAAAEERTEIHDHGIPEPPQGAPTQVRELVYAIRSMWDAEESLSLGDTGTALGHEREALKRLKSAQAAIRYIPPIAPRHTPVDIKRRYQGELQEIETNLERLKREPESSETLAIRSALAETYRAVDELQALIDASPSVREGRISAATKRAGAAAEMLLGIGGEHAALIAESAGQLRIIESELSRMDLGSQPEAFRGQLERPLALLVRTASSIFSIAKNSAAAASSDSASSSLLRKGRTGEYFKRLASGSR